MNKNSLNLLSAILEHIHYMIFLKDADNLNFVYINQATTELTGYKKEDLLGKSDFDLFPKDQAQFFVNKDREVLASGTILEIPDELITTHGRGVRHLHTRKIPLNLEDGSRFLLGISEDITDRKRLEEDNQRLQKNMQEEITKQTKEIQKNSQQLKKEIEKTRIMMKALEANENQLRLIANALPMRVAYIDQEHTYTFVNSTFEKWFAKSASEILGYTVKEIVGTEFYQQVENSIDHAMKGKVIDFELTTKDEVKRSKSLHITYLPDYSPTHEVQGLVEITRDITEKKRQDEEKAKLLSREQAAQQASEMKSEFLANMSHEIRTPINGVIGMIGLLLETSLTAEQRDFAENAKRSANSLLTIINDILDFSKVEAGKLELDSIPFDLVSTFLDLEKIFKPQVKQKGLHLTQELDPKIPLFVQGDPGRIRQVVTNLVGNAIKFTKNGKISIRLRVIDETDTHVKLLCEVEDTGVGISTDIQNNLFKPFSQGGIKTYRNHGGTGLGLSISRRLLELMHGEIDVKSVEGSGSTFHFQFTLPKVDPPKIGGDNEFQINVSTDLAKQFRVLVAEDNFINQEIIVKILEKFGFNVNAVSNGNEAIQILNDVSYDFVLMDCQMPEMDGYEATQAIRNDPRMPNHIPIIAMTANAMKGDSEKCLEAGMDDYIAKPISKIRLANILNKWMGRLQEFKQKRMKI